MGNQTTANGKYSTAWDGVQRPMMSVPQQWDHLHMPMDTLPLQWVIIHMPMEAILP
ncbi:MAG: hypothetical protein IPG00_06175 [Saprospiraceae bacterium]|nr:hypothetical protein [Saprospiraceae bacterium]